MGQAIGIDLGTTYSVVAYINPHGIAETIRNEANAVTTPSVIYFDETGPVVGTEAKEQQAFGEANVAAFFKRQMGDPNFYLTFHNKNYTPVDLSAIVLTHLKQQAEVFLQEAVTHAVITVPAYFNNHQREATMQAGRQAGLTVLSIISEPMAAAFAYGIRPQQDTKAVLVYDLGGGTFDVSVVKISPTEQRGLGVDGDHQLGGKDWDDQLCLYLAGQFKDDFGIDLVGEDYNELLTKAEETKKALSARTSVNVRVQGQGQKGNYTVTQALFEELTADLMGQTQILTEVLLDDIQLTWADLDTVLLVGGSTRMPMVKKYVEQMSGQEVLQNINPDEAVALGAAIQAAMEMEKISPPKYTLAGRKTSIDVISHSLGMIATNEDHSRYVNSIIIPKNQTVPATETRPYELPLRRSGDNELEIFLTQGETNDPLDCNYLGRYRFTGIPTLSTHKATFEVTYSYDNNQVVQISVIEQSTGTPLRMTREELPDDVPERFNKPPVMTAQEQEPMVVYLAFDLSGSMSGNPIEEAKKAAHAFVEQCDLNHTAIGIIGFSDSVAVTLEATEKANQISTAIDNLRVGQTGGGNATHPFDDILRLLPQEQSRSWLKWLRQDNYALRRYALVLADGVWSNQGLAIERAKRCHQAEIDIIGIGFGTADKTFMKAISSSDEHSFYTDLNQLTETFSTIAQELTGQTTGLRV